ncbi:MAG TPA: adenylate/guanylate cyclase domain-containing protein [Ktedonobacterales bacterium]|nr:adenylate/guanylate cyclase domain-containing protein [Ktedonobacterales bacterium]HEV2239282.1 adenylate/guanylate cyclase domain-containing protein [Ktedonobacterales bacterium]
MKETKLTILFADVCGSTKLYETLGDSVARDTVAKCVSIMGEETQRQSGRVVKTIGDEVMSVFEDPSAAADAAGGMQERISSGLVVQGKSIAIRVGFHFGPVIVETDGDVYGDAVNTAARMAGQAKAGQILTTAATVEIMSDTWKASTRQIDRAAVKGKKDEIDMIEILWQREDVTRMSTSFKPAGAATKKAKLMLRYRDQSVEVNESNSSIVMGRADENDLVVKNTLISRLHARIEYRKGNFVLVDQSINGTYVRTSGGEELFVRRDNYPIKGSGIIGLGQRLAPESPDAISFQSEE